MTITRFLTAILLLASSGVTAQVGFGPMLGIGVATMKFAPSLDPIHYTAGTASPILGGMVGGVLDVPMNKHLSFQSGIGLSRKGAVRSFSYYYNDSFNESVHQVLHIAYADVPLMVFYKTGVQGQGRFTAGIGATLSYIVGGRNLLQDHSVVNDTLTNTSDNVKIMTGATILGFDVGLTVVAGYELPTGLFFRAYYTDGNKDIGTGTEIDKNRAFGITAGYIFGKGRNINKEASDLIDNTPDPGK